MNACGKEEEKLKLVEDLNLHLTLRTFICGYELTLADLTLWSLLTKDTQLQQNLKQFPHAKRWFEYCNHNEKLKEVANKTAKSEEDKKSNKGMQTALGSVNVGAVGSYNKIVLENAEEGKVVVRFPPEPSGFLHMGHVKAVLLNSYYREHYKGKFLLRFDDTNPSNEKEEYVESIKEDLKNLGVTFDQVSRTSEYFQLILDKAEELIKNGDAYVDDTPQEKMSEERNKCVECANRSNSVEKNQEMWKEMLKGSEKGLKCVLRAKIDMKHKIAALRDPSLARCMNVTHPVSGDKFKVYPLYDLACPIVDSVEGVTHALRDSQYCDRKEFYFWVLEKLKLRKVHLKEFSRLNFEYTLLSKRKLEKIISKGIVENWESPAIPTVRGILARGMHPEALRVFIQSQGASLNMTLMSMDKLWAINKKLIDPVIPRFFAILKPTPLFIDNFSVFSEKDPVTKNVLMARKFKEQGEKPFVYSSHMWVEQADALSFQVGEEVTFMDFGNVKCHTIEKEEGGELVKEVKASFVPDGDFKKTDKKVTWLSKQEPSHLVPLLLWEYDYIMSTKKLSNAEGEDWEKCIRKNIKYETKAVGDPNLKHLKKGDRLQLERLGYWIVHQPFSSSSENIILVGIPDGHHSSPSTLETAFQTFKRKEYEELKAKKDKEKEEDK